MTSVLRPAADWELASFLADATKSGAPLEIVGGHTKAKFGRPRPIATTISTHVLRGIRSFNPAERIVTVQGGCLISDIEREVQAMGQMLGFEPVDVAGVFGEETGRATIGGTIASNLAGSRRIAASGIGESLLGMRAVAGTGEVIQVGGGGTRGTDGLNLMRAIAGSWGTLAVMVEVSLRVQLLPERTHTLVIFGLSEEIATEAMSGALATPFGVTGTVHLEPRMAARLWFEELRDQQQSVTALRLENPAISAANRVQRLKDALKAYGELHVLDDENSVSFWHELRLLSVLTHSERPLWRISTLPSKAFEVVSGIRRYIEADAFYDWSGGLIWLEVPKSADAGATEIRRVIASTGGHATLVRASDDVKASIDVFEPMHSGVELMSKRIKKVFDPSGILNRGRMFADM